MLYEKLLNEAHKQKIDIYEKPMKPRIKGLYADNVIWINESLPNNIEKACILAEELGHYHTSTGSILDQSILNNRKQEKLARKWASERLVTPTNLIEAFESGCRSRYEIADYLNVTELFLEESLKFYREKYGTELQLDGIYTLFLDPLAVFKAIK